MEDGPPLLLGLEINKVFGVEEAGGVRAVVGAAGLAHDLRNFRERGHHQARLVGEVNAGGGAFAGRQRAADPDGALVEVGQKLRTDGAAQSEIDSDGKEGSCDSNGAFAVENRGADSRAIVPGKPKQKWVFPLVCILAEE